MLPSFCVLPLSTSARTLATWHLLSCGVCVCSRMVMVFWGPLGLSTPSWAWVTGSCSLILGSSFLAWARGHTSQVLDPASALAGGATFMLHTSPRPSFLIVLLGVLRIQGHGETFCSNSCTGVCGGQVGRAKLLGLNLLNLKFSPP